MEFSGISSLNYHEAKGLLQYEKTDN